MALFSSSTRQLPAVVAVPRHVAVIMDGNGRWAKKRLMPRFSGHAKGVGMVRKMVRACLERMLEDGERVEIYRPLIADPKEVRKQRAAKAAQARAEGGGN